MKTKENSVYAEEPTAPQAQTERKKEKNKPTFKQTLVDTFIKSSIPVEPIKMWELKMGHINTRGMNQDRKMSIQKFMRNEGIHLIGICESYNTNEEQISGRYKYWGHRGTYN